MLMVADILLTLFLVLLNGFFVAAEFAIVKVRSSQVDIKMTEGNRLAGFTKHMLTHLDAYLSATQLGITLASLGLGWIGEDVVSRMIITIFGAVGMEMDPELAHKIALPTAFALITFLHIVFGELAPKSLAIRYPLPVSLSVSPLMRFFYYLFMPFIWLLNGFANLFLRMLGVGPMGEQESHSEEEIRLILDESHESGEIRDSELEMIENVFRFDESTARKVMVPRTKIVGIEESTSIEDAIHIILEEGYTRIPVYHESLDEITGIIYSKELFKAHRAGTNRLKQALRPAYFVPENKRISELLREFQRKRLHMAVVVDEYGGTAGIVTLEDLLEEIVGEIQDESDREQSKITRNKNGEWIVEAGIAIEDLNRYLPENIPEDSEEYETLTGFIHHIFRRIPDVKEKQEHEGYEFEVATKEGNNISRVIIRKAKKEE